jgi:chromosome partitioning protein
MSVASDMLERFDKTEISKGLERFKQPKVIAFLNPKGGVGKTTCVINIATCLTIKGYRVAVIDTDPQPSITNWNSKNLAQFDIFDANGEKDIYEARKLKGYDFIIIDGAAALSVITSASVMVSHLVIVPVSPSPLDYSASGAVISVVDTMRQRSTDLEARFLITRYNPRAAMTAKLRRSIEGSGVKKFRTAIAARQSFVKTLVDNKTIFDSDDGNAKGEIGMVTEEILTFFRNQDNKGAKHGAQ